jgi:hypothetical protein
MRISLKQSSAEKQHSGDHFVSARDRVDFEGDHSTGAGGGDRGSKVVPTQASFFWGEKRIPFVPLLNWNF